jgi:hypothetical protein
MMQDAFGGRAAQCVENAVVSRRRHGNEISFDFCGSLEDRFDHVSLPNLDVHRNCGQVRRVARLARASPREEMDG